VSGLDSSNSRVMSNQSE